MNLIRICLTLLLLALPAYGRDDITVFCSFNLTYVNTVSTPYRSSGAGGSCPGLAWNNSSGGVTVNADIAGNGSTTWSDSPYVALNQSAGSTVSFYAGTAGNLQMIASHVVVDNGSGYDSFSASQVFYVNGSTCAIVVSNPPCTTNIVFNVQNNDSVGHTYGVGQKSTVGADPYCTYKIGVAPRSQGLSGAVQSASPGQTVQFVVNVPCDKVSDYAVFQNTSTTGLGAGSDGQNQWYCFDSAQNVGVNPTPYSGTIPTNAPVSGITTNTIPASSTPSGTTFNPTNSTGGIIWTAASGTNAALATQYGDSALYDAVNKGFQQTHTDLQGIQNGLTNIHVTVNSSNNVNGASNVWVQNWPTNLFSVSLTNSTGSNAATESTLRGISNLLASAYGSTNGTGTNSLSLTNYAEESTLAGMSNLLSSLSTNYPASNGIGYYLGNVPNDGSSNSLASIVGASAFQPDSDNSEGYGNPIGDTWKIEVPYLDHYTIDLNPFHQDWVVHISAFFRSFVMWVCAIALMWKNIHCIMNSVQIMASARQAQSAGTSILGNNINTVVAVGMAVAITSVCLAVPFYVTDWFGTAGLLSIITAHPFHTSAASVGTVAISLWMVDQFFPLAFMVWCLLVAIGFRMSLTAICYGCLTIIRFLVG